MFCCSALKEWRKSVNYTQRDMAKLLNLSSSHYAFIEKGDRQPSTKLLSQLLAVTGLSSEVFFPTSERNENKDFLKFRITFLEARLEILKLYDNLVSKEKEITKNKMIISILRKITSTANTAVQKKYSMDRYLKETIEIAKSSVQNMDLSCDVICEAFDISINTLKKWLGENELLFNCDFNLFQPVYAATPELAGEAFKCIDCIHLQKRNCKGFGISIHQYLADIDINIFTIINDLTRKGITDRSEQLKILKEQYNFQTTESTLNEYMRRYKKGEHVPDSFKFMISNEAC